MALDDPATWGVALRTAQVNGIEMRYADSGGSGPVVLLMHGWPESWFSYRHQPVCRLPPTPHLASA